MTAPKAKNKVVEQAKKRFAVAVSAETDQRKRELEVLKFDAGDQWPQEVKDFRKPETVGGMKTPARPMLTIPKTNQPVRLVVNQQRQARLGILVHPESDDADDDTAEILQGLIRHIEVRSRAHIARQWAFERSTKIGRGVYRILTEPADFGWAEFGDQEIVIKRVLNQASAYFDPSAEEPDWSDGRWAFIGGWMLWDRFKQEFPESELVENVGPDDNEDWEGLGDAGPDWVTDTDQGKAVRVMEYFCVHIETLTRCAFEVDGPDGSQQVIGWIDTAPEDRTDQDPIVPKADVPKDARKWDVDQRSVKWYKLNGIEILEEQDWHGQYIPLIPVIGDEFNVDGKRQFKGMIEPAMDGGRMFNYAASALVEKTALSTRAPWILAEGQEEGHEPQWAQANTRNFPYMLYKPTTIAGHVVGPPVRNFGSVDITPELAMLEQADDYIKSVTAIHDPSLGEGKRVRSGKAEIALQSQADSANSNYLDAFASVPMPYEAKVLLDVIPHIYDRPGRVTQILGANDERKRVMLNEPFITDPQTKQPQSAKSGIAPYSQVAGQPPPQVKQYDLAKGRYSVTVSVGKSHPTMRQEGADKMGGVLQAVPQVFPIIGDLYFKYQDFPGAKEISDRLKKALPAQFKDEQENGQPTVEQLTQQLQQGAMAFKQLQQQAGELKQQLDTEAAKQGAAVEIAKHKEDSAFAIAEMQAKFKVEEARIEGQAKVAIEQIKANLAGARVAFDAEVANEREAAGAQHESSEAERQRQFDIEQADMGMQHETGEADRSRQHEATMAEDGHRRQLEADAMAAQAEPAP